MEIYLTDTVTGEKKQFPVAPNRVKISAKGRFQEYDIMSLGEVVMASGDQLTHFMWEGILPGEARKNDPYVQNWIEPKAMQGFWSVIRENGHKAKLMATDSPINHAVYLVNYDTELSGAYGDYSYNIEFVVARELIVETEGNNVGNKKTQNVTMKATDRPTAGNNKEYIVKPKDTLFRIAQKELGNGNKYKEIASLNNLKNPDLIRVGQVLKLP